MALIAKTYISTRGKDGVLKEFKPGDTLTGFSKEETKRLTDLGALAQGTSAKDDNEKDKDE